MKRLLPMTTALFVVLLVSTTSIALAQASRSVNVERGWVVSTQTARADTASVQSSRNYYLVKRAVCHYFTGYLCGEAMVVVGCETGHTYSVWARNGQYRGLFQMGSHERATYGDSNNAWGQARAAHNYYMRSGWSPWQCTPYGGLRW